MKNSTLSASLCAIYIGAMEKTPISPNAFLNAPNEGTPCYFFRPSQPPAANAAAAAYLRGHVALVMDAWVQMVRRHAHDIRASMSDTFLRNGLPTLLCRLADVLEDPHWSYSKEQRTAVAQEHGQQRQLSSAYTINMMLEEYALLRHVVRESLRAANTWPADVMARVHAFIDASLCAASRKFFSLESQDSAKDLASQRQGAQHQAAAAHRELQASQQRRDSSDLRAATAEADLLATQQQRDSANNERDAGRSSIAALLEEKRVRERVVALLSHDLRSPLASILVNTERLQRKPGDAQLAGCVVPRILRATKRIDQMIQDMLDVSRLRAGQAVPLVLTSCDLVQVAAEAHEDYASTHGSRIRLESPERAPGSWDSGSLRRVIDNLVGNAIKYGAKDSDITIAVEDLAGTVRVSVHNFGHPLGQHEIATLFTPYVRSERAEMGEERGWGLGLTLVQGVVRAHRGRVGATSAPDTGTTFWFELPKSSVSSASPEPSPTF